VKSATEIKKYEMKYFHLCAPSLQHTTSCYQNKHFICLYFFM